MLDPDISTAAALAQLSRPDVGDSISLDRRRFLQLVGAGLGAGLVAGPGTSLLDEALGHDPSAWALGPVGQTDGILLVVGLYGGNDGLNTIVPVNDGHYYDQHGRLAIDVADTIALDASTGLNPELTEFKRFWDAGQLAVVEGVGHGQEDFSHFSSMARWMSGRPTGVPSSGWVGRWLDGYLGAGKDLFAAAEVGHSLPLHMIGERSVATTVPASKPDFGVPRSWRPEADVRLFQTVRDMAGEAEPGSWLDRIGQAQVDQLAVAASLSPVIPADDALPENDTVAKFEIAARLINANLGFRVLTVGFGDFDSHAGQPSQHPDRMRELNASLARFFATLDPAWAGRTTVMTFSEFGRTSHANDGQGTDHGSSGPQFVMGAGVKGGFFGQRPSLAGLARWERMPTHVPMTDYYGSVIDGWLGGGASDALPGFRDDLGLFSDSPTSDATFPGSSLSEFVAMAPERIYDTRQGIGGRSVRIGPGETVDVTIAGAGSIPSTGVTAVSVNITSINPASGTWIAAFPSGYSTPSSSTLNPRAGQVVPNMSVVGVGANGKMSLYNDSSSVHVTVDVMGYFRATASARMMPLSPRRILDTRKGIGAPTARVRGGKKIELQVLGQGGVPSTGVDAVVLNVASMRPTTDGWVTAWPTGVDKPVVANLSYRKGTVVPNLMMCKVGPDGKINLEASSGQVDLLADVVGCFTTTGSQLAPVAPARLLDTRKGIGAAQARVGAGQEVTLQVTGRGGVPNGATAVALNVSAVRPTAQTFLTTYPNGESMPTASSLNPDAGRVSANLVIAKLGDGGKVKIYNDQGDVDLLADLTAYFI